MARQGAARHRKTRAFEVPRSEGGKTRQYVTWQDSAGLGKAGMGGAGHGAARATRNPLSEGGVGLGRTRQGKAQRVSAWHGKTRQGQLNPDSKGTELGRTGHGMARRVSAALGKVTQLKELMKLAIAQLENISTYSQSRHYEVPKMRGETAKDHEERTWRERMHVNEDGFVYMPPMSFKNCISEAAKFMGKQIPGKGKSTYTKHFEAGVLVMDPLILPVKKDQVQGEWLFVPSDGKRGGGSRVMKCFPAIPEWKGEVKFYILDETITQEVFEETIKEAGSFIGVGRFRPRNNGFYGRFKLAGLQWLDWQQA